MWTKQLVDARINESDACCEWAVFQLFLRQTADEQNAHRTVHSNKVGFNAFTAFWGTFVGKAVLAAKAKGQIKWGTVIYARHVKDHCRKVAQAHAGQVAKILNGLGHPVSKIARRSLRRAVRKAA